MIHIIYKPYDQCGYGWIIQVMHTAEFERDAHARNNVGNVRNPRLTALI